MPLESTAESPFLTPFSNSSSENLAILYLSRDLQVPVQLKEASQTLSRTETNSATNSDADRDIVVNTRFGSFPHSTLVDLPWGSQVLASKVDTGSWAKKPNGKKRKRDESQKGEPSEHDRDSEELSSRREQGQRQAKPVIAADSGFAHLVPPTPEIWTRALKHRTQVVYTPDYSYILQRLRVRPGTCLIEAGAGSGSFTHAAARAVFNVAHVRKKKKYGKVYSFEFHEPRAGLLEQDIVGHGLQSIVQLTHRDVYKDGFCVDDASIEGAPRADAIFLDLPAPWLALKHLIRGGTTEGSYSSPLNPRTTTRICTFSPCIEQAQRTITTLRSLGWVEIEMVEIMHKRLEVRRERVGLQEEGLRGVNPSPANVSEAFERLKEIEGRQRAFHENQPEEQKAKQAMANSLGMISKAERLKNIRDAEAKRKLYKEGRLVHRTEPELKTHTSYLVFAVLSRQWTADDEKLCREKWPLGDA
ncbi:tRNA methyltransferase complex GCD14 subunit [Viridothelium virens]|uniref:tRNA (adenine(58)-N(1))-methyltransferase catalytic subunit TRM61 n=1 Tax=Viridothelium virens TaxID=1048519 RepID=A0A6A6HGM7_VIRVR|nr:tRNA methyltransferase complex GCD14 subunit [Viridothelium virens]